MATIKKIRSALIDFDTVISIKCNSKGDFYIDFPEELAEKLGQKNVTSDTLQGVERKFTGLENSYKEHQADRRLIILIQYSANGAYLPEGAPKRTRFSNDSDSLSLDYKVRVEETDYRGKKRFYYAYKSSGDSGSRHIVVDGFDMRGQDINFQPSSGKIIPYCPIAHARLENAKETMSSLSSMIWDFFKHSEDELTEILASPSMKLLS